MTLHLARRPDGRWKVKGRLYGDVPAEFWHRGLRFHLEVALYGCRGGRFEGRPLPEGRAVAFYDIDA